MNAFPDAFPVPVHSIQQKTCKSERQRGHLCYVFVVQVTIYHLYLKCIFQRWCVSRIECVLGAHSSQLVYRLKLFCKCISLHLYSKPWLLISDATIKYTLIYFEVEPFPKWEEANKKIHTHVYMCNTYSQFAYFLPFFSLLYRALR